MAWETFSRKDARHGARSGSPVATVTGWCQGGKRLSLNPAGTALAGVKKGDYVRLRFDRESGDLAIVKTSSDDGWKLSGNGPRGVTLSLTWFSSHVHDVPKGRYGIATLSHDGEDEVGIRVDQGAESTAIQRALSKGAEQ